MPRTQPQPIYYRHKRFVMSYLLHLMANSNCPHRDAALELGYSKWHAATIGRNILNIPQVKEYMATALDQILEEEGATTRWKVRKLKHIADVCAPDDMTRFDIKDLEPRVAIAAVAEISKLEGAYPPDKHINMDVGAEEALAEAAEQMKKALEEYKQPY